MRLTFKEDPNEWRKAACLGALGFAIMASILRWRGILPPRGWWVILMFLGLMAIAGILRPAWFRGYYRLMHRVSFLIIRFVGFAALLLVFLLFLAPLGILLRLSGKDLLRLRRKPDQKTYWVPAKAATPLDKLF